MERMFNMLNAYYQTLIKVGYIPINISINFLVLDFLNDIIKDKDYPITATCEQKKILNELYKCVTKTNCFNL